MKALCWQCWNRVHRKKYAENEFYLAEGIGRCESCGRWTELVETAPPSGWRRLRKWFWERKRRSPN